MFEAVFKPGNVYLALALRLMVCVNIQWHQVLLRKYLWEMRKIYENTYGIAQKFARSIILRFSRIIAKIKLVRAFWEQN